MTKAKKTKEEVPPVEPEIVIQEQPVPPSVTLDEVESIQDVKPEPEIAKPEVVTPAITFNPGEYLPDDKKIVNFIESRPGGDIKLNDFLKSLFPLPKFNEPPNWMQQNESKKLKGLLEKMVQEGKLVIQDNNHLRLGQVYYANDDQRAQHHNLNTVNIVAKK